MYNLQVRVSNNSGQTNIPTFCFNYFKQSQVKTLKYVELAQKCLSVETFKTHKRYFSGRQNGSARLPNMSFNCKRQCKFYTPIYFYYTQEGSAIFFSVSVMPLHQLINRLTDQLLCQHAKMSVNLPFITPTPVGCDTVHKL